ncbi:MAG: ankyrin repeat domain-containing protein [Bacteroidales bacterium]|nr:ankyrin repeat domain-containing protein [Bacteroidales bacterium]
MRGKIVIVLSLILILSCLAGCMGKKEGRKQPDPGLKEEAVKNENVSGLSIHEAALNGQINVVIGILETGMDPDTADEDGRTALMYAAFNGHTETIKRLVEKGANVNLRDPNGRTPLMMAASGPYSEAVKILLENNADPDMADNQEHFTALMFAAAEGQMEVVRVLLSYRADPSIRDVDGDDALTFAVNNGHKSVADLLRSMKK